VARHRNQLTWFAAALLLLSSVSSACAQAEPGRVNNIREAFERFRSCWRPPPASRANPMDITVIVSFNRAGEILGHPRITYESAEATDNDRVQYRIAVMEALQRCTPMPFTESMAGAVAGRPFAVQFHNRKPSPQAIEKRAWLTPKIL
jgi:hypothetical protein